MKCDKCEKEMKANYLALMWECDCGFMKQVIDYSSVFSHPIGFLDESTTKIFFPKEQKIEVDYGWLNKIDEDIILSQWRNHWSEMKNNNQCSCVNLYSGYDFLVFILMVDDKDVATYDKKDGFICEGDYPKEFVIDIFTKHPLPPEEDLIRLISKKAFNEVFKEYPKDEKERLWLAFGCKFNVFDYWQLFAI